MSGLAPYVLDQFREVKVPWDPLHTGIMIGLKQAVQKAYPSDSRAVDEVTAAFKALSEQSRALETERYITYINNTMVALPMDRLTDFELVHLRDTLVKYYKNDPQGLVDWQIRERYDTLMKANARAKEAARQALVLETARVANTLAAANRRVAEEQAVAASAVAEIAVIQKLAADAAERATNELAALTKSLDDSRANANNEKARASAAEDRFTAAEQRNATLAAELAAATQRTDSVIAQAARDATDTAQRAAAEAKRREDEAVADGKKQAARAIAATKKSAKEAVAAAAEAIAAADQRARDVGYAATAKAAEDIAAAEKKAQDAIAAADERTREMKWTAAEAIAATAKRAREEIAATQKTADDAMAHAEQRIIDLERELADAKHTVIVAPPLLPDPTTTDVLDQATGLAAEVQTALDNAMWVPLENALVNANAFIEQHINKAHPLLTDAVTALVTVRNAARARGAAEWTTAFAQLRTASGGNSIADVLGFTAPLLVLPGITGKQRLELLPLLDAFMTTTTTRTPSITVDMSDALATLLLTHLSTAFVPRQLPWGGAVEFFLNLLFRVAALIAHDNALKPVVLARLDDIRTTSLLQAHDERAELLLALLRTVTAFPLDELDALILRVAEYYRGKSDDLDKVIQRVSGAAAATRAVPVPYVYPPAGSPMPARSHAARGQKASWVRLRIPPI